MLSFINISKNMKKVKDLYFVNKVPQTTLKISLTSFISKNMRIREIQLYQNQDGLSISLGNGVISFIL